jgi:hypothetical protein
MWIRIVSGPKEGPVKVSTTARPSRGVEKSPTRSEASNLSTEDATDRAVGTVKPRKKRRR